jgi:S1-C subfamily serine protease
LGVEVLSATPETTAKFGTTASKGAVIVRVPDLNSPAAAAGIAGGDVITAVNDKLVIAATDLRQIIGSMVSGASVSLTIISNGETKTLVVKLGSSAGAQAASAAIRPRKVALDFSAVNLPD